jgi:hypothetical protein
MVTRTAKPWRVLFDPRDLASAGPDQNSTDAGDTGQDIPANRSIATTLTPWIRVPSAQRLAFEPHPYVPVTPGELWLVDALAETEKVPKKKSPPRTPQSTRSATMGHPAQRRDPSRRASPNQPWPWSPSEMDYFSGRPSRAVKAAAAASSPVEFLAALNKLRLEKGLTYERLGRRAGPRLGISRSSAQAMLTRKRLPSNAQIVAFLHVCRVSPREHDQWLHELTRIQAHLTPPSSPQDPDNEGKVRVLRPAPAGPRPTTPSLPAHARPAVRPDKDRTPTEPVTRPWPKLPNHRPPRPIHPVWPALGCFTAASLAASLIAITLAALKAPATTIQIVLAIMSGCVITWFWSQVAADDREHQRPSYLVEPDPDLLFDTDEPTAPPAIGEW